MNSANDEIALQLLQVVGVLFAAAAAWILLAWRRRGFRESRIWTIYAVEVGIVSVILVPAYLGGTWLLVATLVIAAISSWGLYGVLERGGCLPYKTAGVALGGVGLIYCSAHPNTALVVTLVSGILFAFSRAWRARAVTSKKDIQLRGFSTLAGVLYPSLCLAYWVRIGTLEGGFGYLVFLYALTEINDVAAYLIGGAVGKRRLWPTLSPKKTLEGSLAGAFATVALALPLGFAVPAFSTTHLVGAAVLMAVGDTSIPTTTSGAPSAPFNSRFSRAVKCPRPQPTSQVRSNVWRFKIATSMSAMMSKALASWCHGTSLLLRYMFSKSPMNRPPLNT